MTLVYTRFLYQTNPLCVFQRVLLFAFFFLLHVYEIGVNQLYCAQSKPKQSISAKKPISKDLAQHDIANKWYHPYVCETSILRSNFIDESLLLSSTCTWR